MKKQQRNTVEDNLEAIEGIIENIDPGTVVNLYAIAEKANVTMTSAIKNATIMMLMKYGIRWYG